MKLLILGSAAAEAIPDPFCRCEICETARREGGHEMRARSAALLNRDLLIDLGPDLLSAANRLGLYLGDLKAVLLTHRHEDHWLPSNLLWREPGFAATPVSPLTVYGPADALRDIQPLLEKSATLSAQAVRAGDQWTVGDYQITAVPATHGGGEIEPLLYVVDDGQHRLFYATDTSTLSQAAWDVLRPLAPLDLILLDCTTGLGDGGRGHHGLDQFVQTRTTFLQEGLMSDSTTLVAHHFSHNGRLSHADLVRRFAPLGVAVSYDGLELVLI